MEGRETVCRSMAPPLSAYPRVLGVSPPQPLRVFVCVCGGGLCVCDSVCFCTCVSARMTICACDRIGMCLFASSVGACVCPDRLRPGFTQIFSGGTKDVCWGANSVCPA